MHIQAARQESGFIASKPLGKEKKKKGMEAVYRAEPGRSEMNENEGSCKREEAETA